MLGLEDNKSDLIRKVGEELEVKALLEQEHQNLQSLLQDAQRREKELLEEQWKQAQQKADSTKGNAMATSAPAMSSFAQNLILSKEKEIASLRQQYEAEKKNKIEFQDKVWSLEGELKSTNLTLQELEVTV